MSTVSECVWDEQRLDVALVRDVCLVNHDETDWMELVNLTGFKHDSGSFHMSEIGSME